MKKAIGVFAVLAFLVGCGCQQNQEEGNVEGNFTDSEVVMYSCQGEEVDVTLDTESEPGAAQLNFINRDDAVVVLPQVESASGLRYSDGSVVFWIADEQAMLMVEGNESSLECEKVTPEKGEMDEVAEEIQAL